MAELKHTVIIDGEQFNHHNGRVALSQAVRAAKEGASVQITDIDGGASDLMKQFMERMAKTDISNGKPDSNAYNAIMSLQVACSQVARGAQKRALTEGEKDRLNEAMHLLSAILNPDEDSDY